MIRMPLATASLLAIAISLAGCGEGKDKEKAAAPAPAASTSAAQVAPAAAPAAASKVDEAAAKAVVAHYADMVFAVYSDAESTAKTLQSAVDAFLAKPNADTLKAAKAAWIAARVPYLQSEVFRFGNTIIDDWEGQVNAWPLDEGLIDYVDKSYEHALGNPGATANIIANTEIQVGEDKVDVKDITPEKLASLNELGGSEANVATGYHAIEFLLWGQDLNGTGKGAGNRPATDFDLKNCTNGNCDRRADFLRVSTQLLVDQLKLMAGHWSAAGVARRDVMKDSGNAGLVALFTGLGSLTYGELAGERMKLGLMIHDPEEEHDCFSDNTHNSHYFNAVGIRNIYEGTYMRLDGSKVQGASVSDLVRAKSPDLDAKIRAAIEKTMKRMTVMVDRAKTIEAYDQMIGEDNPEGNAVVQSVIDALAVQAKTFEEAIALLNIDGVAILGSDSLDAPEKVTGGDKG